MKTGEKRGHTVRLNLELDADEAEALGGALAGYLAQPREQRLVRAISRLHAEIALQLSGQHNHPTEG